MCRGGEIDRYSSIPAAPCGRLAAGRTGLYAALGAHAQSPASTVEKFLKDSKGNFFQKVSFGASPFRHFLFASFSFVPEHPVNQSPSAVRDSFSPRRHTTLSAYKICPRSCYLPEAKNILPTVLRRFSLCEKPNGFGLPGALSKEKEDRLCRVQPLCRAPRGTSPYTGQALECAAGMQNRLS